MLIHLPPSCLSFLLYQSKFLSHAAEKEKNTLADLNIFKKYLKSMLQPRTSRKISLTLERLVVGGGGNMNGKRQE